MSAGCPVSWHGGNHHELELEHGKFHVFANDEVFRTFGDKVYEFLAASAL
jgi:hypothetical protein